MDPFRALVLEEKRGNGGEREGGNEASRARISEKKKKKKKNEAKEVRICCILSLLGTMGNEFPHNAATNLKLPHY